MGRPLLPPGRNLRNAGVRKPTLRPPELMNFLSGRQRLAGVLLERGLRVERVDLAAARRSSSGRCTPSPSPGSAASSARAGPAAHVAAEGEPVGREQAREGEAGEPAAHLPDELRAASGRRGRVRLGHGEQPLNRRT